MNHQVAQGKGFGKTILFGDHFVVYGLPAIASAIGDQTVAKIEQFEKMEIIDNKPATDGYKEKKAEEIRREFDALFRYFKINPNEKPLKITLEGNLFCTSGVGASAALATSVSRALNEMLNVGMDDDAINKAAYIAEEAGSGKPSGIDNTCSTFGKLIWFKKNIEGEENVIEHIDAKEPVGIVLADTGITQITKDVVNDVASKHEQDRPGFDDLFNEYASLVSEARAALEQGYWEKVGQLMDKNQELLAKIGVSCDEIENIIRIAKANGAFGAKLTGTGRGGYVIALAPGKELQDRVATAIEQAGFKVLKTTIG